MKSGDIRYPKNPQVSVQANYCLPFSAISALHAPHNRAREERGDSNLDQVSLEETGTHRPTPASSRKPLTPFFFETLFY